MQHMSFQSKVVIITGVTRGIGRACALQFSKAGASVAGIYLSNDAAATELDQLVQEHSGLIRLYKGSVFDREFVAATVKDVYSTFGSVDVLVNNAGKSNDEMALYMEEEQWNDVMETNFTGAYNCMKAVIPFMMQQRRGNIVNLVSVSGMYGREAQTNYAASKGMILGLTKLFARRYREDGISICAIAPGMIETEMVANVPSRKVEEFLQHTLTRRLGTPEEIAHTICFLADPQAAYLTGQVIKMDGGFLR